MAMTADMKDLLPVFVLVAIGVIGLLLLRSNRYFSRQREQSRSMTSTRHAAYRRDSGSQGAPPESVRWEVQMHEKARELTGQLDSKMSGLAALIAEADRAAARLENALAAASGNVETIAMGAPSDQAESLRPAQSLADTADPALVEQSATASPPTTTQRRKAEVYTLADYGFDAREIAHRTQMPIGEVDLMLRLRDSA